MSARMKFLRTLHLFLGCLFAPMLIFFAVTGSWQLFNWHESTRDKTYIAPPALAALSFVHKDAHSWYAGTATDAASLFHARDRRRLAGDSRDRNRHGVPVQS